MRRNFVVDCLLVGIVVIASGCFRHQYLVSGTARGTSPSYSTWQHNFLWGTVSATRDVDLRDICPGGVSRMENFVAAEQVPVFILTVGLYVPTTIRVYCRVMPKIVTKPAAFPFTEARPRGAAARTPAPTSTAPSNVPPATLPATPPPSAPPATDAPATKAPH